MRKDYSNPSVRRNSPAEFFRAFLEIIIITYYPISDFFRSSNNGKVIEMI